LTFEMKIQRPFATQVLAKDRISLRVVPEIVTA